MSSSKNKSMTPVNGPLPADAFTYRENTPPALGNADLAYGGNSVAKQERPQEAPTGYVVFPTGNEVEQPVEQRPQPIPAPTGYVEVPLPQPVPTEPIPTEPVPVHPKPGYEKVIKLQDLDFAGPPSDVPLGTEGPLCADSVTIGNAPLESIHIKMQWKDQGWGGRKGLIVFVLFRPQVDGTQKEIAKCLPFGTVEHQWTSHEISLNPHLERGKEIFANAQKGDVLKIHRHVGGGGGHRLYIRNLEATFTFGRY